MVRKISLFDLSGLNSQFMSPLAVHTFNKVRSARRLGRVPAPGSRVDCAGHVRVPDRLPGGPRPHHPHQHAVHLHGSVEGGGRRRARRRGALCTSDAASAAHQRCPGEADEGQDDRAGHRLRGGAGQAVAGAVHPGATRPPSARACAVQAGAGLTRGAEQKEFGGEGPDLAATELAVLAKERAPAMLRIAASATKQLKFAIAISVRCCRRQRTRRGGTDEHARRGARWRGRSSWQRTTSACGCGL